MKINTKYIKKDILHQIKEVFAQRDQFQNIRLQNIFSTEIFKQLKQEIQNIPLQNDINPLSHKRKCAKLPQNLTQKLQKSGLQTIFDLFSLKPQEFTVYEYEHRDYSILLDTNQNNKTTFDIIIDLSDEWNEKWGGSYVFIDKQGEYIELDVLPNSITILKRKTGERFFTKYINHYAKKQKKLVLYTSI